MNLLAFAASNSKHSINNKLIGYAIRLLPAHICVEHLDLNDYELPIYSQDRESEQGLPALAKQFIDKIAHADALLIAFAEHNGSYTAAYKNLFDWASRVKQKVYQDKPMVLLATSPGPGGAKNVLASAVNSAPFFNGQVLGSLSVPKFYDNVDPTQQHLTNLALKQQLQDVLAPLSTL